MRTHSAGTFALPQPLKAAASGGSFTDVRGSGSPTSLLSYSGPVSKDAVTLSFQQPIGAGDGLRTGTYRKTLVFTLSTTQPYEGREIRAPVTGRRPAVVR